MIKPEKKFRLKAYLIYLIFEPWVTKFRFPNLRTLNLFILIAALVFRWKYVLLITGPLALLFHFFSEWKSGQFINWYRSYHYKKLREKEENDKKDNSSTINND